MKAASVQSSASNLSFFVFLPQEDTGVHALHYTVQFLQKLCMHHASEEFLQPHGANFLLCPRFSVRIRAKNARIHGCHRLQQGKHCAPAHTAQLPYTHSTILPGHLVNVSRLIVASLHAVVEKSRTTQAVEHGGAL
jgi:hypothetical protein